MNPVEMKLARETYLAVMKSAKALSWMDKIVLKGAFDKDKPFEEIPEEQRKLFLTVGRDIVMSMRSGK
jgi:hypothetical protein